MFVDRMISILFPTLQLEGTQWLGIWRAKERRDFIRLARVVFPLIGIAFIANYVFFDLAVDLKPRSLWLTLRLSMAGTAMLAALFYFSAAAQKMPYYRLPAVLACSVFCFFQGRVLEWYSAEIYIYAYAFIVLSVVILRSSLLASLIFALVLLALVWPSIIAAGIETPLAASGGILTLVAVVLLRSGYGSEVAYFFAEQQNLSTQQKIIELNIEFSDRIRTFLPKEINTRMDEHVKSRQMSVFQAAEEVMRPRKKEVSCLFSDIRGFTSATKNQEGFVLESVLPNVRECTRVVEEEHGIPRKIGDLIFAYFDSPIQEMNLLNCTRAAAKVIDRNRFSNTLLSASEIKRHVLVSTGTAVVGNLGGFDSSVEITALGDPVNFLARLDELTKFVQISELMAGNEIVLDFASASGLQRMIPSLELRRIDLNELGVSIRDFGEVSEIFLLDLSQHNRRLLDVPEDVELKSTSVSWDPGYDYAISQLN